MSGVGVRLLGGALHDLIQIGWIWAILIPVEVVFPKTHQIAGASRLKAVALSVLGWGAAGASGVVIGMVLGALNLHPLFTLGPAPTTALGKALYLIGGTAFAALLFDFLYYWFHRAQHTPLLWRFHAVHHAIEDMGAANYTHWTEQLSRLPFIMLPTALLSPADLPVWPVVYGLITLQSQYIHAQTRLHLGPFWRVMFDNRFHRVHHSIEPIHRDRNFGVLTPLWDWMFGTLYVPAKGEWPATGLSDAPEVDGIVDYLWRPFRGQPSSSPAQLLVD